MCSLSGSRVSLSSGTSLCRAVRIDDDLTPRSARLADRAKDLFASLVRGLGGLFDLLSTVAALDHDPERP